MKYMLEYRVWQENKENKETIRSKLSSKAKAKIKKFKFKFKSVIIFIGTVAILRYMYIKLSETAKDIKVLNTERSDQRIKKVVFETYGHESANNAINEIKTFRYNINKKYKKTKNKLSDEEILSELNEHINRYAAKNKIRISVPNGFLDNMIKKVFRVDAKYTPNIVSGSGDISININTKLQKMIYNDSAWTKEIKKISSNLQHEFTHQQQDKNKRFDISNVDKYNGLGINTKTKDGSMESRPYIRGTLENMVEYLMQPIEIEAYASSIARDIKEMGISQIQFSKLFDTNRPIQSSSFNMYDKYFLRNGDLMKNMKILVSQNMKNI